jgi:DNA repair protein RadC
LNFNFFREIMPIKDWPAAERPREKLISKGAATLSDAELLAIFLATGIQGKSALDVARETLRDCGGLRQLLAMSQQTLCDYPGFGLARYVVLQSALELGRRNLQAGLEAGPGLNSPADTRRFLQATLRDRHHEVFAALFLDTRHRVICFEELAHGTIDGASVYPREVVKKALFHNASAVIFAHNHPSGVAEPSQADIRLTRRLSDALGLLDIRVLDHFVVGEGALVSFSERGLL